MKSLCKQSVAMLLVGLLSPAVPLEAANTDAPISDPSHGVLVLEVSEDGADVYIDNRWVGVSPFPVRRLTPAVHVVGASKPGFLQESKTIWVTSGETLHVSLELKPLKGMLWVEVSEDSVLVEIDGMRIGLSPISPFQLVVGEHVLRVRKKRYQTKTMIVRVSSGDTTRARIELRPDHGVILVEVSEEDAEIYVDNRSMGIGPSLRWRLKPGVHVVGASKPGFLQESKTISIAAGDTIRISFELQMRRPPKGVLQVEVSEMGALVEIDGKRKGISPVDLFVVEAGTHVVVASKRGYFESRTRVRVTPRDTMLVALKLAPRPGIVLIKVSEASTQVYIDNKQVGMSPVPAYELATGVHAIGVRKFGYIEEAKIIAVAPGDTVRVIFELNPRPSRHEAFIDEEIIVK